MMEAGQRCSRMTPARLPLPFRSTFSALILSICSCGLRPAAAQMAWPETRTVQSLSRQFTVLTEAGIGLSTTAARMATNHNFVRLEPTLVSVSCERIKQLLTRELGMATPWQSKIFLILYPVQSADDLVTIDSEQFLDGWQYRVELPEVLQQERYVRAIVQVLLLEQSNRNAHEHGAEVPLWLSEGLTSQLLATSAIEIILPPPSKNVNGLPLTIANLNARRDDPLKQAHNQFATMPPLSFEELSWPKDDQLAGEEAELYAHSAHLFVGELLRLNDGRASLRAMLANLPQYFNWQFAFLQAFHSHFTRLLDVEKWWAVQGVQFTGRDLTQTWPLDESRQKLDETLQYPVEVRSQPGELPLHTEVSLQTILREWDPPRQVTSLQKVIYRLDMLRFRVAPQVAGFVRSYRTVLETFLKHRDETALFVFTKQAASHRATEEALKQLDELDARRRAIEPKEKAIAAALRQAR